MVPFIFNPTGSSHPATPGTARYVISMDGGTFGFNGVFSGTSSKVEYSGRTLSGVGATGIRDDALFARDGGVLVSCYAGERGLMFVQAGGTAIHPVVTEMGYVRVESGYASDIAIAGGTMYVASGGIVLGGTVGGGLGIFSGLLVVASGGYACGVRFTEGGSLQLEGGIVKA